MFETFDHTADLGLRIRAANLNDLFAEAARGLFHVMVGNLETVRTVHDKVYRITADEPEFLLLDWLNELLYTFDTEHLLLCKFQVTVERLGLDAICQGESLNLKYHKLNHEVKAITYHNLTIRQEHTGWLAEVIVDI